MFVILNVRNILANYIKYGTQFHHAPRDFIAISVLLGFAGLLVIFPGIAFYLEKLKFSHVLSHKVVVRLLANLEQPAELEHRASFRVQHNVLPEIRAEPDFRSGLHNDVHGDRPEANQLQAGQQ